MFGVLYHDTTFKYVQGEIFNMEGNEDLEKKLEETGLTSNESKTFLALLGMGSVKATDIVKKTGLHRGNVYDSLERLIEKGLVGYITKNNIKYFQASDPEKIITLLDAREEEIEKQRKEIQDIIPTLAEISHMGKKEDAQIYRGKQGIRLMHKDMLKIAKGEELIIFGAEGRLRGVMGKDYTTWLDNSKLKNKIKVRILFGKNVMNPKFLPNFDVRYVAEKFTSPATTLVYGDKISITIYIDPVLVIVVDSKELAESYRNYFELMWRGASR